MNFKGLEKNITDAVRESITKLGFEPRPLTLYFPREALCTLLEEQLPEDMMMPVLQMFAGSVKDTLGDIKITRSSDGRCAFTIPVEGVCYINENIEPGDFTESLVRLMEDPDCDIMEIASLFRASGDAVLKRAECDDFDYVLYFRDGKPDDYRYCFHEEMGRMIYHRFTADEFRTFEVEL